MENPEQIHMATAQTTHKQKVRSSQPKALAKLCCLHPIHSISSGLILLALLSRQRCNPSSFDFSQTFSSHIMTAVGRHNFSVTVSSRDPITWKPDKSGFFFTKRLLGVDCDDHPLEAIRNAAEPTLLEANVGYDRSCKYFVYGTSPATEYDDESRFEILTDSEFAACLPFIPSAPKESRIAGTSVFLHYVY